MKRQQREVMRLARAYCPGAVTEMTSRGHLRVRMMGPLGTAVVFCASTPSDRRAGENIDHELRRAAQKVGTWTRTK